MRVTHQLVDISELSEPATVACPRQHPAEVWYVAATPVDIAKGEDWRVSLRGDCFVVPLFRYCVTENAAAGLGFAFQLGFLAALAFSQHRVQRLHMVIGSPLWEPEEPDGCFRLMLGFAVAVESHEYFPNREV